MKRMLASIALGAMLVGAIAPAIASTAAEANAPIVLAQAPDAKAPAAAPAAPAATPAAPPRHRRRCGGARGSRTGRSRRRGPHAQ